MPVRADAAVCPAAHRPRASGARHRAPGDRRRCAARLVGSGPYRVVDASAGRLALEAVPGHWAGPSRAERLVFLEVATDDHAEAEFDARALDVWFPPAPPRRADWALSAPGLRVGYLAFQTEKEPFSTQADPPGGGDRARSERHRRRAGPHRPCPLQSFLPFGVWARREGSPDPRRLARPGEEAARRRRLAERAPSPRSWRVGNGPA